MANIASGFGRLLFSFLFFAPPSRMPERILLQALPLPCIWCQNLVMLPAMQPWVHIQLLSIYQLSGHLKSSWHACIQQ